MKLNRKNLVRLGFNGFVRLEDLLSDPCQLPKECGIYVVLRQAKSSPTFKKTSPAGWFKNLDPSYPVAHLDRKWISGASVIYIGKAGPSVRRTLRKRIGEFLRFGNGSRIGHRGGRAIWHLPDVWNYQLAWKVCKGNPRDHEKALIREFESEYGKIPFANFTR
jgi:hypothetical protein